MIRQEPPLRSPLIRPRIKYRAGPPGTVSPQAGRRNQTCSVEALFPSPRVRGKGAEVG